MPAPSGVVPAAKLVASTCRLRGGGRFLSNQDRQARKGKRSAGIVDHVNLAGIEPRLKLGQGDVELEHRSLALRGIELARLYQRGFEGFYLPIEEKNAGEEMDW